MVWSGISIGGQTDLHFIWDGNWTTQRYADEIMRPHIVTYAAAIGDSFILIQDNVKPHTAHLMENCLEVEPIS
ncbi:hypothetical protein TNCV_444461 [Trichonephila clavipes]|nr:hypothetical protein TNCV_444461 [Trichonephila clavipes]